MNLLSFYLALLIAVFPRANGRSVERHQELLSHMRHLSQLNKKETSMTLKHFKEGLIDVLEIPQFVEMLFNLFTFIQVRMKDEASRTLKPGIKIDEAKEVKNDARIPSQEALRELKEYGEDEEYDDDQEEEEEETNANSIRTAAFNAEPTRNLIDSVVQTSELLKNGQESHGAFEDDEELEHMGRASDISDKSKLRRLQMLKAFRERTGEVIGDILYGKK